MQSEEKLALLGMYTLCTQFRNLIDYLHLQFTNKSLFESQWLCHTKHGHNK